MKRNKFRAPFPPAGSAISSILETRQDLAHRLPGDRRKLRFRPLVQCEDLPAWTRQFSSAVALAAARGSHERFLEAAIHRPHEEPRAVVGHFHASGGFGD